MYDPQLGRWTTPDPLDEISRRWSPYSYCYNDPAHFIDPDGMMPDFMPGDPDRNKNKEWNPFEDQNKDDFFHKPDYRAPIDRFHDDPEQYEEDQWNRERQGITGFYADAAGNKTKKDKKKEDDKSNGNNEKRPLIHSPYPNCESTSSLVNLKMWLYNIDFKFNNSKIIPEIVTAIVSVNPLVSISVGVGQIKEGHYIAGSVSIIIGGKSSFIPITIKSIVTEVIISETAKAVDK